MTATVDTIYLYYANCPDCPASSDLHEDEARAEEWAATHNAENHEPDAGEDENYERFKESRYEN